MKKFLLAILFLSVFPSITLAQQTSSCVNLTKDLRQGMKNANTNNEVIVLQKFLKAKGFLTSTPNGSFGPATLSAVKKFQSSVGIGSQGTPGYGGIGPKSRAKIKEMTCGKVDTTARAFRRDLETNGAQVSPTQTIQTGAIMQNQPTTSQLQSEFLKNEPIAQQIASGQLEFYDIRKYGFRYGLSNIGANSDEFAFRFMNGIKMTGQITAARNGKLVNGKRIMVGGQEQYQSEDLLNRFQSFWGLPTSPNIDVVVLKKLDSILVSREAIEKALAVSFPLYDRFIDAPKNQETKTHVAYLFAQTFKELPSSLVVWSEQNFMDYIKQQLRTQWSQYGKADTADYKVCDLFVWSNTVGDGCGVVSDHLNVWDDFTTAATRLHEYAHYLDKNLYSRNTETSRGLIDTTGFYSISYDINNRELTATWPSYKLKNPENKRNEFVTLYAMGWTVDKNPEYISAPEDFAESFAAYITQGKVFRAISSNNYILKQKYDWLKQNVFGGVEYQSGASDALEYTKNNPTKTANATGAGTTIDFALYYPDFVWNYQFLNGSLATK